MKKLILLTLVIGLSASASVFAGCHGIHSKWCEDVFARAIDDIKYRQIPISQAELDSIPGLLAGKQEQLRLTTANVEAAKSQVAYFQSQIGQIKTSLNRINGLITRFSNARGSFNLLKDSIQERLPKILSLLTDYLHQNELIISNRLQKIESEISSITTQLTTDNADVEALLNLRDALQYEQSILQKIKVFADQFKSPAQARAQIIKGIQNNFSDGTQSLSPQVQALLKQAYLAETVFRNSVDVLSKLNLQLTDISSSLQQLVVSLRANINSMNSQKSEWEKKADDAHIATVQAQIDDLIANRDIYYPEEIAGLHNEIGNYVKYRSCCRVEGFCEYIPGWQHQSVDGYTNYRNNINNQSDLSACGL